MDMRAMRGIKKVIVIASLPVGLTVTFRRLLSNSTGDLNCCSGTFNSTTPSF